MIKLKSGKEFYANHEIIGITPKTNRKYMILTEGYDGEIFLENSEFKPKFSKYDLYEIADIMINRWNEFKRDVANNQFPVIND